MSEPILLSPVPIQEMDMHEARTDAELRACLKDVMLLSPGFIVRGELAAEYDNFVETVSGYLEDVKNQYYVIDRISEDVAKDNLAAGVGSGRLHDDASEVFWDRVIAHETTAGIGMVATANSGELYRNVEYNGRFEYQIGAGQLFRTGLVMPDVISPEVHVATLSPGDWTIFPVTNQSGPVWHRFGTYVAPRSAQATALKPVPDAQRQ
jgi:hypothetical protein